MTGLLVAVGPALVLLAVVAGCAHYTLTKETR